MTEINRGESEIEEQIRGWVDKCKECGAPSGEHEDDCSQNDESEG